VAPSPRIGKLTIGGSVIAGVDDTSGIFRNNGAIRAENDLGDVTIKGSLVGNFTNPAIISARGQAVPSDDGDLAIGKLTVKGRVENALILAGFNPDGDGVNADAQIGPVSVGGNWVASSIAAGSNPGIGGFFGTADDLKMSGAGVKDEAGLFSKITSLKIGGQALGSLGPEHYGVVAEIVGSVKVGSTQLSLLSGASNDDLLVGITGNFKVNEI